MAPAPLPVERTRSEASIGAASVRPSTRRKILISTQAANRGKAGKKLGVAQKEAAYMVSQLDKMRDLLCWADPKKTAPLVAMNFVACVAHMLLPPRYVMPFYALGAFSGLTEQFYGCMNVGSRFQRAVRRYKALQDKLRIPGGAGLQQLDRSADPALWSSVQQCRKSNQKMMERALRETIGNRSVHKSNFAALTPIDATTRRQHLQEGRHRRLGHFVEGRGHVLRGIGDRTLEL